MRNDFPNRITLQYLSHKLSKLPSPQYQEYEEVVMEDRAQKEKAKKAAEKAELEIRCATKVCISMPA